MIKPSTKPSAPELTTRAFLRGAQARRQLVPWLLIAPALIIFALLFVIPLIHLFLMSISPPKSFEVVLEKSNLSSYIILIPDSFFLSVLWRTIKMAFIIAMVCLLVGYPFAYYMVRSSGRKRAYLTLLVVSPLLVNVLALTFGWYVVLGPTGIVSWILLRLGLASEQVNLLFTETAVIIGLTHVFLAYMVLAIAASLQNIDPALPLAAQSLGADKLQVLLKVTLPLSLPGVVAGWLVVFTLSASAFATPALLGGPFNKVMSFLVYQQALYLVNWPLAGAIAFILMFSIAILVFIYIKGFESGRFRVIFQ